MTKVTDHQLAKCPRCRTDVLTHWEDCDACGTTLTGRFPAPARPKVRIKKRWVLGAGLAVLFGISMASADDSGTASGDGPDKYGAFDVCRQAVERQLKAPSTAEFRNPYQDDGEVSVTGFGDGPYTVRSSVDAQNGFGAQIRTDWSCTATHISGTSWRTTNVILS